MGKGTTFREDEITLLNELFATLNRGGDPRILMRNPAYASVVRKFMAMKIKVGP